VDAKDSLGLSTSPEWMLRTYDVQQRQLLPMARNITLPQTNCRECLPRFPFSSGSSVSPGSSVSSSSSVSLCAPSACDSRNSFSLETSVLTATAKACLVGQLGLVGQLSLTVGVKELHRAPNQRFRLIKRRPSSLKRGKETFTVSMNQTGLVALRGQRLGEHQRRTA